MTMIRPYELWIGLRYTRAKRRNHFISFISMTSMIGIALGVTALIVVLSVMNGFQEELRNRILGVAAHMEITGPDTRLTDWPALAVQVERHPEVRGLAPYVLSQGLLAYGSETKGGLVRGVLPEMEGRVAEFDAHMKSGRLADLKPGAFNIVLGAELAYSLGVGVGDPVTLIAPQGVITPAGMLPRMKQFTVVGLFKMGMYEYDAGLALIHLDDAKKLYRLGDAVSGLRIKLADMDRAPWLTREFAGSLQGDYYISDWTMSHANFFRAVQIEKRMMFIILTLIVAVAAFNIVSTLVMAVTDKQADIAILRTLGASPASIMQIFMVQGSLIGVIGTLLGVVGGVLLALNVETVVPLIERALHMDLFPADVYYISELPSKLVWSDVAWIGGVALILSFLATLYPSRRAATIQPAEALRYE
ncbi:lipoprotein-releasing system permease protein [Sulfuritortus calidifontis]|uniref:Lipoprotein-releasing system permease protein n=1 Tax=Sulfuritortus calidifontis TaxID=1914471 RepID=A0A4R3K0D3_9PROT|nr:lipoprotein-releasing ABC transporter permease subunit [Sulfuritortus calidifontis]TCS73046.1 lipoprotein-releasing system permease protein [Sulfuritortus calidifontis]